MSAADFPKMSTKKTDKWIIGESKYLTSSFKSWKCGIWGNKSWQFARHAAQDFEEAACQSSKVLQICYKLEKKKKKNFIISTPLCCSTFMCGRIMCLRWHHRDKSLSPQQDVEVANREKGRTLWALSLVPFYMMPGRCDQFKWTWHPQPVCGLQYRP